ncbi:predicted protein, partial [Nematostella vectensis]
DPLGVESGLIDNKAIRATSWITIDDNPKNARLNNIEGEGAWCPRTVDQSQFLEINIGHVTRVTSVATQGRFPVAECHVIDAWVTKFALEYLDLDGMAWKNYTEQGVIKIFSGNTDLISTVNNVLTEKLITKAVKFRPKEWHTRICMRVELYGSRLLTKNLHGSDLGMQTSLIPDSSVSASSTRNLGYKPSFARIGRHYGNGAWCAANDTLGEYLQIFEGHRSHLETVRNDLAQNITARYVRLRPRLWAYELMIKMELYG